MCQSLFIFCLKRSSTSLPEAALVTLAAATVTAATAAAATAAAAAAAAIRVGLRRQLGRAKAAADAADAAEQHEAEQAGHTAERGGHTIDDVREREQRAPHQVPVPAGGTAGAAHGLVRGDDGTEHRAWLGLG